MKKSTYLFLLLLLCSFFSCKENNYSTDLLEKAQATVDNNPEKSLTFLDSICNPEAMDERDYMLYAIISVQAKYKTYKDISNDTLIFQSKKYFSRIEEPYYAALASYYSGIVFRDRKVLDKALGAFLNAKYFAEKVNDKYLTGKSFHFIGNIYYDQLIMDSAIVNYKEALKYYTEDINKTLPILQVTDLIGIAYEEKGQLDSAYIFYNRGLDLAIENNNKIYKATFAHNLGIIYRDQKNYKKASEYLHRALTLTANSEEVLRINLSLSKLYNTTGQLDSAKYYIEITKKQLPNITNDNTLRSIYGTLSDFSLQNKNYKDALYYKDLQKNISESILKKDRSLELLNAEKKHKYIIKEKELANFRFRTYIFICSGVFFILLVLLINFYRNRNRRLKYRILEEENKLLRTEKDLIEQRVDNYDFVQHIYSAYINRWHSLEKKVKVLTKRYVKEDDPVLYGEIGIFIRDITEMSNIKFVESAKDFLSRKKNGVEASRALDETQLLLLMLCHSKHGYDDIINILGQELIQTKDISQRIIEIKEILNYHGLDKVLIYEIFKDHK